MDRSAGDRRAAATQWLPKVEIVVPCTATIIFCRLAARIVIQLFSIVMVDWIKVVYSPDASGGAR